MNSIAPRVLVHLSIYDSGEFGNATCPHCGAKGRYVHTYLTTDGANYSAMAGCLKLAGTAGGNLRQLARLSAEALARKQTAARTGAKIASWWAEICDGVDALAAGRIDVETLRLGVVEIEQRRQGWLSRNGYGKRTRRMRR